MTSAREAEWDMQENVLDSIRFRYAQLTRLEKRVADYVLQKPWEVPHMSISDLAQACGVGESTVFRFCHRTGARGYQNLKVRLDLETASLQRPAAMPADETALCANRVYEDYLALVRRTREGLDLRALDRAVERLADAEQIALIGTASSGVSVLCAYQRLALTTAKVSYAPDMYAQRLFVSAARPGDVVIAFSYTGRTPDIVEMAARAKAAGAYVIAVCAQADNPLSDTADQTFLIESRSRVLSGWLASLTAHAFVLDVLCELYLGRLTEDDLFRAKLRIRGTEEL